MNRITTFAAASLIVVASLDLMACGGGSTFPGSSGTNSGSKGSSSSGEMSADAQAPDGAVYGSPCRTDPDCSETQTAGGMPVCLRSVARPDGGVEAFPQGYCAESVAYCGYCPGGYGPSCIEGHSAIDADGTPIAGTQLCL